MAINKGADKGSLSKSEENLLRKFEIKGKGPGGKTWYNIAMDKVLENGGYSDRFIVSMIGKIRLHDSCNLFLEGKLGNSIEIRKALFYKMSENHMFSEEFLPLYKSLYNFIFNTEPKLLGREISMMVHRELLSYILKDCERRIGITFKDVKEIDLDKIFIQTGKVIEDTRENVKNIIEKEVVKKDIEENNNNSEKVESVEQINIKTLDKKGIIELFDNVVTSIFDKNIYYFGRDNLNKEFILEFLEENVSDDCIISDFYDYSGNILVLKEKLYEIKTDNKANGFYMLLREDKRRLLFEEIQRKLNLDITLEERFFQMAAGYFANSSRKKFIKGDLGFLDGALKQHFYLLIKNNSDLSRENIIDRIMNIISDKISDNKKVEKIRDKFSGFFEKREIIRLDKKDIFTKLLDYIVVKNPKYIFKSDFQKLKLNNYINQQYKPLDWELIHKEIKDFLFLEYKTDVEVYKDKILKTLQPLLLDTQQVKLLKKGKLKIDNLDSSDKEDNKESSIYEILDKINSISSDEDLINILKLIKHLDEDNINLLFLEISKDFSKYNENIIKYFLDKKGKQGDIVSIQSIIDYLDSIESNYDGWLDKYKESLGGKILISRRGTNKKTTEIKEIEVVKEVEVIKEVKVEVIKEVEKIIEVNSVNKKEEEIINKINELKDLKTARKLFGDIEFYNQKILISYIEKISEFGGYKDIYDINKLFSFKIPSKIYKTTLLKAIDIAPNGKEKLKFMLKKLKIK